MCVFLCQGCAHWRSVCCVVGWPAPGGRELCTVISRYSKQTDSPSLKLSLEASDEMAQIMRHIINHRQGAAGSVYMCYTHTLSLSICHTYGHTHTQPVAKSVEQWKGAVASERSTEIITKAVLLCSSWLLWQIEVLQPKCVSRGIDKSRKRSMSLG